MATIGSTAPSQHTINFDSLLTTTWFNYRPVLVDNIYKMSAFMAALKQAGGVETAGGGERIQIPLMYEGNNTVKSYSGYESLDTTPQEGFTSAFFDWREVAGTVSISRKEERQNSGEAQLLNLLQKKLMQVEMSIKESVNTMLVRGTVSGATFIPGNSTKDLNPLGWFFRKARATDPTSGGNVGNIAAATYAWWKSNTFDASQGTLGTYSVARDVTSYKGYLNLIRTAMNTCSNGADGSAPNLLLGTQGAYELYCNAIQGSMTYTNTGLAEIGFDNVKVRGATMIYDEVVPDVINGTTSVAAHGQTIFFINTKFYKLVIDSESNFVQTPFIEPENQTARTAKILFMGNATISNPRKCGVMIGIDGDIAS